MADEQPTAAPQKQLLLQKIYVKDLSFESPKAPMVFTTNAQPQTQLNVRSSAQQVAPDTQEVTLTITVEAKDKDSTLFLAEVGPNAVSHTLTKLSYDPHTAFTPIIHVANLPAVVLVRPTLPYTTLAEFMKREAYPQPEAAE